MSPVDAALDRGILFTDYTNLRFPRENVRGAGDGVIAPAERYQAALDLINSDPLEHPDLVTSLAAEGLRIPYLFQDDPVLLSRVLAFVTEVERGLVGHGSRKNSADYNHQFVAALRTFVTEDLQVVPRQGAKTLGAIETVRQGAGPCVGIDNVYLGLLLLAGYRPVIQSVEWSADGAPMEHYRLAIYDDPANPEHLLVIDGAMNVFGEAPAGEAAVEVPITTYIAMNAVNKIRENPNLPEAARRHAIELALKLAPYDYRVLTEGIRFYQADQNYGEAGRLYQRALEVFPAAKKVLEADFSPTSHYLALLPSIHSSRFGGRD